jgi:ribosomal protein L7/L12
VDIWLWIVIIVAVALVALVIVGRRGGRAGVDPTQVSIDPAVAARVRQLYAKGDKLPAVKVLREATGLGLADAVRIADRLGATAKPPATGTPAPAPGISADIASAIGPDHIDELRSLVGAGQQIEAITLVRRLTGMGLQEAKDYVDRL